MDRNTKENKVDQGKATIINAIIVGICAIVAAIITAYFTIYGVKLQLQPVGNEDTEVTQVQTEEVEESGVTQELADEDEVTPPVETQQVIGYSSETAIAVLKDTGFPIVKQYSFSDTVNIGCVVSADLVDDSIVLVISKGGEYKHCSMYKIKADGSVDYIRTYHRDEEGNPIACNRYDGQGNFTNSVVYENSEDGVLKKLYTYNLNGSIHHTWVYTHDNHGRIIEQNYYDVSGSIIEREEYLYDSEGRVKEYLEYDQNGLNRRWVMRGYDDTVSLMSCSPHTIGNWNNADIYDKNGKLIRFATQTFDEHGVAKTLTVKKSDGSLAYQYVFQSAWVNENNDHANDVLSELGVA